MKHFLFFLLALVLLSPVVYAQGEAVMDSAAEEREAPVALQPKDETVEKRMELSKEMHKIWPVRPRVESAIDLVGENAPQAERASFKAAMRRAMDFEALEAKSIETMAEIFTVDELQTMIEFYGSKEGRSVSFKTGDYESALQPFLIQMVDKALLDTRLGAQ